MTPNTDFGSDAKGSGLWRTIVVSLAGVGLRVESNSAAVTDAFRTRYPVAELAAADAPHCELHVCVASGDTTPNLDSEARWQFPDDDRATVAGPGLAATIDLAAGRAIADVGEAFVRDHLLFRRSILEGIPLTLITRRDRHPVHAACVRQGSSAVLLHGSSGVGKSTLAYVAYRAGLDVLADDATRIQMEPELRAWGDGTEPYLHLLTNARNEFAELRGLEPDWLSAGGTAKLSIRTQPRMPSPPPFATAVRVCLLTRDGGAPARRPASPAEIREALMHSPEAAADRSPKQRARVAELLAERGGWHLNLSANPTDAIPHLRDMLAAAS